MTLPELGERFCILGPSNSGKPTIAAAIVGLPIVVSVIRA
jgi:ABC-type dipeptide/oligopeptide/nickel transport system ATPase subunit